MSDQGQISDQERKEIEETLTERLRSMDANGDGRLTSKEQVDHSIAEQKDQHGAEELAGLLKPLAADCASEEKQTVEALANINNRILQNLRTPFSSTIEEAMPNGVDPLEADEYCQAILNLPNAKPERTNER